MECEIKDNLGKSQWSHGVLWKRLPFMNLLLHLEKGYIEEKELDAFLDHVLTTLGTDVSTCTAEH